MDSALVFENVGKRYGRQTVLNGVTLEVRAGEFFGLVGVNGAGKTTLIKGLLDLSQIDGGTIRIFGVPHHETRARQPLAFLPERFVPPYYATGKDFLKCMTRLYETACTPPKLNEVMAALDLAPAALGKPVRNLSKGMAQKLGLAATLLSEKKCFVLDEPMSGLDPKARALLKRHLAAMKPHGQTIFFSTHLLPDVEELCDRIAILHEGSIRFVGTPAECCLRFGAARLEQAYLACVAG